MNNPLKAQWWRTEEAKAIRAMRRKMYGSIGQAPLAAPGAWRSAVILITCLLLAGLMLIAGCPREARAEAIPAQRAINAIIGEAENQGERGMLAIACGIRNRGTLKGVYGERAPRVLRKLYTGAIYQQAKQAWEKVQTTDACGFLDGADHWENITAFGKPKWAFSMKETFRFKDHVFYRSK